MTGAHTPSVGHTPGPWAVGGQHRRAAVYAGKIQVAFAREEYGCINSTVAEANARMIAAAPDLLDALLTLLPRGVSVDNQNWADGTIIPVDMTLGEVRKARAAIARATSKEAQGTGFVHGSVVRDLIAAGLVEHRIHRGERQIRAHSTKESDNVG